MDKNTGVLIEAVVPPTDFVAGAVSGIVYKEEVPSGNWEKWLPTEESQKPNNVDTMACVTFSALNILETQFNRLLEEGLLEAEAVQWLLDNGYIIGGKFNFSDRFTAKMSGTTPNGNYLQLVADSIRNDGLIPEADWKAPANFSWNEYYSNIPPSLIAKGKEFAKRFDVQYEWVLLGNDGQNRVEVLKKHLKQAPIQIASKYNAGACDPVQHAYAIYDIDTIAYNRFDSYSPYKRNMDLSVCLMWGMKYVTSLKEQVYYVAAGEKWYVECPNGTTKTLVNLNYRTSPQVLADNKVGTLPAGSTIEILENAGTNGGYQWLKVKI